MDIEKSINDILMTVDEVKKTLLRFTANNQLAYYYRTMAHFADSAEARTLYNIADNLENCNSRWSFNDYKKLKIKDKQTSFICHNKFCPNCQKQMQATRLKRFSPEIEAQAEHYALCHMILTVPSPPIIMRNGTTDHLTPTLNKMTNAYKKLVRYLSGNAKIKGLDFTEYGYAGSIRALEIMVKDNFFHPHFHCIIAFKKDFILDKYIINTYSRDYHDEGIRYFSPFEILIQKIWRLLFDGVNKITLSLINNLELGYSCVILPITQSAYQEVFKYVTKVNEKGQVIEENAFFNLYYALYKRRLIQGYGIFHNIKIDDTIDETVDTIYNDLINRLNELDTPIQISESLVQVLFSMQLEGYVYINRSKINSILRELDKEDILYISSVFSQREAEFMIPESPSQLRIVDIIKKAMNKDGH